MRFPTATGLCCKRSPTNSRQRWMPAQTYAEQQEEAWVLAALLQTAENIARVSTLEDLLATVVRLPPLLVGCERCACYAL